MTRKQWLLVGILGIELLAGGYLLVQRGSRASPPLADFTLVDPLTAKEISTRVQTCRTAANWAELGEMYLATGFFPEAEICLAEACVQESSNAQYAMRHAFALERLGKVEEANERYRIAISLNHPRWADCWYYIGKNHLRLEQVEAARQAFERAQELPAVRYELAVLDAHSGQREKAETEAKKLMREYPNAYPPVSLLYRLMWEKNDRKQIGRLADEFTRRPRPLPSPFDLEVNWVFGLANRIGQNGLFHEAGQAMREGRIAEVEKKLRTALEAGWDQEIADRLAEVLYLQRQPREAMQILKQALVQGRPSVDLLWRLGQTQQASGQPEQARDSWERAVRLVTGPAKELYQDLASFYERAGEKDRARQMQARALLSEGIELLDGNRPLEAMEPLIQALQRDPGMAQAWYFLGEARRGAGRQAEARQAYEQCLQRDPECGRARRALELLDS